MSEHAPYPIFIHGAGGGIDAWDAQVDHNLKSVFLGCKHVLPVMEKQGGGMTVRCD